MDKETEQKIAQLQLLEQNLQGFLMQKQQFQTQLVEVESALEEIKDAEESFKIVGSIMVKAKKQDLEKDLKEKKEMLELRIKTIEKQEKNIKDRAEIIQKEVLGKVK